VVSNRREQRSRGEWEMKAETEVLNRRGAEGAEKGTLNAASIRKCKEGGI